MTIQIYDLAASNSEVRFSPFCWRVKLALAFKGLKFESIPIRFVEKNRIAFSGQKLLPVLVDNEKVIVDSWDIARYLDKFYPTESNLLLENQSKLLNYYTQLSVQPLILKMVILDIFNCIDVGDRDYFRTSREARFGNSLELIKIPAEQGILLLQQVLQPIRLILQEQPFLGGNTPDYQDFIAASPLLMTRFVSSLQFFEPTDPIFIWLEKILDLYGGLARNSPTIYSKEI